MRKEEFDKLLEEIRPLAKDQISKRIKNGSFAKVIIWCCVNSSENDFLCVRDLAKFMRISLQRARYVLEDMVKFDLLKRNKISGCSVDYYFSINNITGRPKVYDYFEEARNMLGIRLKAEDLSVERKGLNTSGG